MSDEQTPSSILDHPAWPLIKPWVKVIYYPRDGGHKNPRFRLEIKSDVPPYVYKMFPELTIRCAACFTPISPIRRRKGPRGSRFLAVSCKLYSTYACARTDAATEEYLRIRADIEGRPTTTAAACMPLFEE